MSKVRRGARQRRLVAPVVAVAFLASVITATAVPASVTTTAAQPPRGPSHGIPVAGATASGTYQGPCRVAAAAEFARWRGTPNGVIVDTLDLRRWSTLASPKWWTACWGRGAPVVYGVAMIMGEGGSLASGAAGAQDATYRALARTLVAEGQAHAWLRLGFEFNGSWYPWRAAGDPAAFASFYRRIVTVMSSVPGAAFRYVWNPTLGAEAFPAEKAWPGNAYVDAIGLDVYDVSYAPGTYPIPDGSSASAVKERHEAAWRHYRTMDHGLDWWARYARQRHKPLALPEWGLVPRHHHGGGDNAVFIERLSTWMKHRPLAFESYFDAIGALGDHRLRSGQYPRAAQRYRERFGR